MTTDELQAAIEAFAPSSLQEDWDNTGWNVNLHNDICSIMVCLDVTPAVVSEAAAAGCGAIVSHHPLLFRSIKQVDSQRPAGRVLTALIAHGISLYCAHTSADSTLGGINTWLGEALGLTDTRPLLPQDVELLKVAVTVPPAAAPGVRCAMTAAGAGSLGSYSDCTFSVSGQGTFRPLAGAHPAIGHPGELEQVDEVRIEALVQAPALQAVTRAVLDAHPYEMPALDVYPLRNAEDGRSGLGVVGMLPEVMPLGEFAALVRDRIGTGTLRVSGDLSRPIRRVGLVGGAGHDLIADAQAAGCDVFLTGELRHNSFYDYDIPLIEAGHYDTEKCFTEILCRALRMSAPVIQYKVEVRAFKEDGRPYIDY